MNTFINSNIDMSLGNLNMSYHVNISEMEDFNVKHVGEDKYKLVTLSYNGWDELVETELTPVPVSEHELVIIMDSLADKYWEVG